MGGHQESGKEAGRDREEKREVDRTLVEGDPSREEHRAGSSQRRPTNLFYLLYLGPRTSYMSTGRL